MKPQTTARVRQAIDLDSHRMLKRLQAENAELRNRASALMLEILALRERQSSEKAQPDCRRVGHAITGIALRAEGDDGARWLCSGHPAPRSLDV